MLKPSGTAPVSVRRAPMLPIEAADVVRPYRVARNTYLNTLKALEPGQSFEIKRTSRAAVYAMAKKLNIQIRIVRYPAPGGARVWRMK